MIRLILKSSREVGQVCSDCLPSSSSSSIGCYQPAAENSWMSGSEDAGQHELKNNTWTLTGTHMIVRSHVTGGLCGFTAPPWIGSFQHAAPPPQWMSTNHFNHLPHNTSGTNPIHQVDYIMRFFRCSLRYIRALLSSILHVMTQKVMKHLSNTTEFRPIQVESWEIVPDVWAVRRPSLPVKRSWRNSMVAAFPGPGWRNRLQPSSPCDWTGERDTWGREGNTRPRICHDKFTMNLFEILWIKYYVCTTVGIFTQPATTDASNHKDYKNKTKQIRPLYKR